jgi:hypothetical protein
LDLVSVFEFKRVGLSLKPKQGSRARLKPMMKKMDTVGFGFSSVDLNPGFLGTYAGSDPAQPETSSVAFLGADLGLLVSGGFAVRQLGSSHEFMSPVESRFVFPPLRSPEMLSLDACPRSKGTSLALVSNVVRFISLGASPSGVACSAPQSSFDVLPLQESTSQLFIASSQFF